MSGKGSPILKLALFATGLSGIVAEYTLSTLASYILGDSVIQWTLTLSCMLFAMGLGSRFSKLIQSHLIFRFFQIELLLSVIVSLSSLIVYSTFGLSSFNAVIIYGLSIAIGLLIGFEIPLVMRLNDEFEKLRFNVASVMEMDYLGSLLGGLFFAFIALPYIGLSYTPIILGSINFAVALVLLFQFRSSLGSSSLKKGFILAFCSGCIIVLSGLFSESITLHQEQKRYKDKIIYTQQSAYQKIVLTQWKDNYWLFLNGHQQFSTVDEERYHEVLAHAPLALLPKPKSVLILGGGDGIAANEVLKYPTIDHITLVDLDPAVTELAKTHPILRSINQESLLDSRVSVLNQDGFTYMRDVKTLFDVIIIDLPDPKSIEIGRLYTREFYTLCYKSLRPGGVIITQAGSPFFAPQAFRCIWATMDKSGFETLPLHNNIMSLGEWGWIMGQKPNNSLPIPLKKALQESSITIPTRWMNEDALTLISEFGKDLPPLDSTEHINSIQQPVLYKLYLQGRWDLY